MKTRFYPTSFVFGVLFALFFCKANFVWSEEIAFEPITFQEALKKAEDSHQLIFVDAYTTWCGPCKQMAKNVFTNDEVAKFFSSNFICLKLDMEKGEGKEFAEKY